MSTASQKSQILEKMRNDKEYRDLFVAEQIFSRLPLKIRMIRKSRPLNQRELAERAGVAPEWITQVENPNYGRFTLKTLLKIASALDVGLYVDFVPYSKVVNDTLNLASDSFQVPTADEDVGLLEPKSPQREDAPQDRESVAAALNPEAAANVFVAPKSEMGRILKFDVSTHIQTPPFVSTKKERFDEALRGHAS